MDLFIVNDFLSCMKVLSYAVLRNLTFIRAFPFNKCGEVGLEKNRGGSRFLNLVPKFRNRNRGGEVRKMFRWRERLKEFPAPLPTSTF